MQQFHDATLKEARRVLADLDRDVNTYAKLQVTHSKWMQKICTQQPTDNLRPLALKQMAKVDALAPMLAMAVFQYGSPNRVTRVTYEYASEGSRETEVKNGGTIGDKLIGQICQITITADIATVLASIDSEVTNTVAIVVSIDNMVLKCTLLGCMMVAEAFQENYNQGKTHYQFSRPDRVYHQKLALNDDRGDDGIQDEAFPTQQQVNAGISAVYARQFSQLPYYEIEVQTVVARVLGIPVLTDSGIRQWMMAKVRGRVKELEVMLRTPKVDPADVNAWIRQSFSKSFDHLA